MADPKLSTESRDLCEGLFGRADTFFKGESLRWSTSVRQKVPWPGASNISALGCAGGKEQPDKTVRSDSLRAGPYPASGAGVGGV